MIVKLLTEHHLKCLSLKEGCTGSSESTLVKIPHCWKSHVTAHLVFHENISNGFHLTKRTRKCDHGQTDRHTYRERGEPLYLPTDTCVGVKLTMTILPLTDMRMNGIACRRTPMRTYKRTTEHTEFQHNFITTRHRSVWLSIAISYGAYFIGIIHAVHSMHQISW